MALGNLGSLVLPALQANGVGIPQAQGGGLSGFLQSPGFAQFAGALNQLGAADTAQRDKQAMLGLFANRPEIAQAYYGAQNQQANNDIARQTALAKLARLQQNPNAEAPSAIQEYEYFRRLNPEQKREYLLSKRSAQTFDAGGEFRILNADGTTTAPLANKTLAPADQPANAAAKAGAQEQAKLDAQLGTEPLITAANASATKEGNELGDAKALLAGMEAGLPKLEQTVQKLYNLSKTATYTKSGVFLDDAMRQAGFPMRDAAIDRREYISTVDNEILPLLRQTFGAAFTASEGESLKNTLGDPNASPEEKQAVLRSFIDNKRTQIEALQRQTGVSPSVAAANITPEQARAELARRRAAK